MCFLISDAAVWYHFISILGAINWRYREI